MKVRFIIKRLIYNSEQPDYYFLDSMREDYFSYIIREAHEFDTYTDAENKIKNLADGYYQIEKIFIVE